MPNTSADDRTPVTAQVSEGTEVAIDADDVRQSIDITSVISIVPVTFRFAADAKTPGGFKEQTVAVDRPPATDTFVLLQSVQLSHPLAELSHRPVTENDLQHLNERPLSELAVNVFLRGLDDVVCQVRLTDADQHDAIEVRATILFFTRHS